MDIDKINEMFPGFDILDMEPVTKRSMMDLINMLEDTEPSKLRKISEGATATVGTIAAMAYIINERDKIYEMINELLKKVIRQEVRRTELFRKVLAQGVMIDSQNVRISVIEGELNV